MDDEAHLCDCGLAQTSVMTFDGGGMRGYASLVILQRLMELCGERERQLDAIAGYTESDSETPLPCIYFDYIMGTSTGGLIAIMLARLRMSVAGAQAAYRELGGRIFGRRRLLGLAFSKYDHRIFEQAIIDVVKEHCHDRNRKRDAQDYLLQDPDSELHKCRTALYSLRKNESKGDRPYVFRSYIHQQTISPTARSVDMEGKHNAGDESHLRFIWQAARATAAAPTYFKPIKIDDGTYYDGGPRVNNPSSKAWSEVRDMHEQLCTTQCQNLHGELHQTSHQGCRAPSGGIGALVSIGTGLSAPLSMLSDGNVVHKFLRIVKTATNKLTDTEPTHLHTEERAGTAGMYYSRFNVESGLENFKLDACRIETRNGLQRNTTTSAIAEITQNYIDTDDDVRRRLRECAELLVSMRRSRCAPDHGERFRGYTTAGPLDDQVRRQRMETTDIMSRPSGQTNGEPRSPGRPLSPGLRSYSTPIDRRQRQTVSPFSPVSRGTWPRQPHAQQMSRARAAQPRQQTAVSFSHDAAAMSEPYEMAHEPDPHELAD